LAPNIECRSHCRKTAAFQHFAFSETFMTLVSYAVQVDEMRLKNRLYSVLVITALAAHMVYAQQASILVTLPNPATMVLRSPIMARQLALSHSQVTALDGLLGPVETELWQISHDISVQRNQKALALLGRLKTELRAVLLPYQGQRYQQILWQAQGAKALLDPDLAQQLSLTPDQQHRIATRLMTLQTTLSRISPNQQAQIQQARNRAQRECFALLNVVQRERLRLLVGLPVDFSKVVQRAFKAPEFTGVNAWINSHGLTRAELQGRVTIVHFYTYGCINCVRNLPHYNSWFDHFKDQAVQVVGIHKPESSGEYAIDRVTKKAAEAGIPYPVAVDNDSRNWEAWGNRTWPSVYLVDKLGFVRYWWYGELNWQGTPGETFMRQRIEALLNE
jgi:peroxiredoxin